MKEASRNMGYEKHIINNEIKGYLVTDMAKEQFMSWEIRLKKLCQHTTVKKMKKKIFLKIKGSVVECLT
jgi:hypothetical protein